MTKKLFIAILVASMASVSFIACQKHSDASDELMPSDGAITFGVSGEGLVTGEVTTKATTITPTTSVTNFKALAVTGTPGSSESAVWNNRQFSNSSGTYSASPKAYWPSSNASYSFYAVAAGPRNSAAAVVTDVPNMTAAAGGPSISVPVGYGRDLICAFLPYSTGTAGTPEAGKAIYKTKNNLVFRHVFARISTVSVSNVDAAATISNISIWLKNTKTGGTYNLYTGRASNNGTGWSSLLPADGTNELLLQNTSSSLAPGSSASTTGSVYNATDQSYYIVPGTYKLIATWTASVDQYTQTYSSKESTASFSFVGGAINAVSCRLSGDPAELQFSVSVTDWTNNSVGPVNFNH